jgi:formylglycine-generating enzyme required for sulfatase activity
LPLIFAGVGAVVLLVLLGAVALAVTVFQGGGDQPTASAAPTLPSLPASEGMVQVPAGAYPLGVTAPDPDHAGARTVDLAAFWIDQYEVTNAEYAAYVESHGAGAPYGWQNDKYPQGEDRYPVRGVSFDQAATYCQALAKRLPQETEWEAAARGPNGLLYPWGDDANAVQFDPSHTHEVGSLPETKSPSGAYDMAGNVWEWVSEPYEPVGAGREVLRGGSYNFLQDLAYRLPVDPSVITAIVDAGFRCAASEVR